jgi:lysyl endopeptidase
MVNRKIDVIGRALLALVMLGWALPVLAGGVGGIPAERQSRVSPLSGVATLELAPVDLSAMASADKERREMGLPYQFAEPRRVDITPADHGTWEWTANGLHLWRLRIRCPAATSLNLGFGEYELPAGATLLLYAEDGEGPVLRFAARDNREHRQLWTPLLATEAMVVELQLPASEPDFRLRLRQVGCGYRKLAAGPDDQAGSCNIDVVCAEGNPWHEQIATVGVYTVAGSWTCTGAMVNNTAQDQRPLFLSAYHCEVDTENAASVVVYWNFESPECGMLDGGRLDQFTNGANFLAKSRPSDFLLVELADAVDPAFGVNFAGWDRSATVPVGAVAIHHPRTAEKCISFDNDPLTLTSYLSDDSPGNSLYFRVGAWEDGTTEPGSSGSPLFEPQGKIVGQLRGGYAACGNQEPDWYGRLSASWDGEGTPDTRLRDHLDPEGLAPLSLDLLQGPGYVPLPPENANLQVVSYGPNPFVDFVEFRVTVDRPVQGQARIYDLAGRLRARLDLDPWVEGENVFAWGGRGLDGQPLAAGLYVILIEADGRQATRRVMRLN